MSQQNLDDADVHASLKQVCGEAMAKRVRAELTIEPALALIKALRADEYVRGVTIR